jgi:hypothetical protein
MRKRRGRWGVAGRGRVCPDQGHCHDPFDINVVEVVSVVAAVAAGFQEGMPSRQVRFGWRFAQAPSTKDAHSEEG